MSLALWALFIGVPMVTMVLAGTLLGRLPLSSAMVDLALGWMLGPDVLDVLQPDPRLHAALLGHFAEVALLISLFAACANAPPPLRRRTRPCSTPATCRTRCRPSTSSSNGWPNWPWC